MKYLEEFIKQYGFPSTIEYQDNKTIEETVKKFYEDVCMRQTSILVCVRCILCSHDKENYWDENLIHVDLYGEADEFLLMNKELQSATRELVHFIGDEITVFSYHQKSSFTVKPKE